MAEAEAWNLMDQFKYPLSSLTFAGVDSRLAAMQAKMDAITGVYDDLHEKMHEIDKTRRNHCCLRSLAPDQMHPLNLNNLDHLLSCQGVDLEKVILFNFILRNNLMIHGIKPDFTPEIPQELERKIQELIR